MKPSRAWSGAALFLLAMAVGCPRSSSPEQLASPRQSPRATPTPVVASYDEPLPDKITLQDTELVLAEKIGERNLDHPKKLELAKDYIVKRLERAGYKVELQKYLVKSKNAWAENIVAERPAVAASDGKTSDEILVVGAHYDSVELTPGANDNGSGTAVLLQLAEHLAKTDFQRTVRFVFFVNEEPPYFLTEEMGSDVYARACAKRGDHITGMISLETMGYYSDEPQSQHFPVGVTGYPDTGNFLGFICDPASKPLLEETLKYFDGLPEEHLVAPQFVEGVNWSDHASFWKQGYQALMVTDTAPFRYPHYHKRSDTPDKIDYPRLGMAAEGMEKVVLGLGRVRKVGDL